MQLLIAAYRRVERLAAHAHAEAWLLAVSFTEAIFLPVPPDVMLIPMTTAHPARWLRYAVVATLASALGALSCYALGHFAFEFLQPWLIAREGWHEDFLKVQQWLTRWQVWVVLVAGFTPLPYKLATFTAGTMSLPLLPFVLASLAARGLRFSMVTATMRFLAPQLAKQLLARTEILLLGLVLALLAALLLYFLL